MNTYISLFSSAGVGCYGFELNGFECIATNELLSNRLDIQRANHKCRYDSGYICGDITLSSTQERLFDEISFWKEREGLKKVDVIFATPPCQGMSTANYKKSENEQVRNSLVVQAIKLIAEIKPKVFIFENVRSFLKTVCTDTDGTDKPILDSILSNLSKDYYVYHKVINFKDYGIPSSRPRTIVIGTYKREKNLSPISFFPSRHKEITLKQAIGDLPCLAYGEKDANDILHFARLFPIEQLPWIEHLKEGQSAFNQTIDRQPGYLDENGEKIVNRGAYMGNKYRRLTWDKVCSCIHTRNDILSSQDTIHPVDNRVLSIRELMRVMTIPDSFHWTEYDDTMTVSDSDKYLKDNELNIRRCIGEAVPTDIIKNISSKIKKSLLNENSSENQSYIYKQIIGLHSTNSTVRVKAVNIQAFKLYANQLAEFFSDKHGLEIDCVEFSDIDMDVAKTYLSEWDLNDFVSLRNVSQTDKALDKCEFSIENGNIKLINNPVQGELF